MKTALALVLVVVAGCSSPAPIPDESARTPAPTPSPSGHTDAARAEILTENVEMACDARPQPDLCRGFVELTVEDGWAHVTTALTRASAHFADPMCQGIAALTLQGNGDPIGVTDVRIFDYESEVMTECAVPTQ